MSVVTSLCREARKCRAGGRLSPNQRDDAVTFDTTDAQIVRPYRTTYPSDL